MKQIGKKKLLVFFFFGRNCGKKQVQNFAFEGQTLGIENLQFFLENRSKSFPVDW
jgi:hypothetical protein